MGLNERQALTVNQIGLTPPNTVEDGLIYDGGTLVVSEDTFQMAAQRSQFQQMIERQPELAAAMTAQAQEPVMAGDSAMLPGSRSGDNKRGSLQALDTAVRTGLPSPVRARGTENTMADVRQIPVDVYDPKVAEQVMLSAARDFAQPVELYGIYRGTNRNLDAEGQTDFLDQFVMPRNIIGVDYDRTAQRLDPVLPVEGATRSEVYVKDNGEYGLLVYEVTPDRRRGKEAWLPANEMILPQGRTLADFITPQARKKLFGSEAGNFTDEQLVEAMWDVSGTDIRKNAIILPNSGDADVFAAGSKGRAMGGVYTTNNLIRHTLNDRVNFFNYGMGYGDIHNHLSSDHRRAPANEQPLIDAVGYDYYALPSPADILQATLDEDRNALIGMQAELGVGMKGVIALTPNGQDILGRSYIDLLDIAENDPDTAIRLIQVAEQADKTKHTVDNVRFLNMIRTLVTDTPPSYVSGPDSASLTTPQMDTSFVGG